MSQDQLQNDDMQRLDLSDAYQENSHAYDATGWRAHILLYVILTCIVSFIIWANIATLDEITRGNGQVIPSGKTKMIQNLEGGIIKEILVEEGQKVKAGDVLVKLNDTQSKSDHLSNKQKYLSLLVEIERLSAIAEGRAPQFEQDTFAEAGAVVASQRAVYETQISNHKNEKEIYQQQKTQRQQNLSEIRSKIKDMQKLISYSQKELAMVKEAVEKGALAERNLLQQEKQLTEQEAQLTSFKLSEPKEEAALKEAIARLEEFDSRIKNEARQERAQKEIEAQSLKQNLFALADRQNRTDVISPVDGFVKNMQITTIGGVVQAGQVMMEIVPEEDHLLIEAMVTPQDIAFIHPGQKAIVKIMAYDFSIYGGMEGVLTHISADTIPNEKGEAFYHIRVKTNESKLISNGKAHEIIPGMTTSVDILTGKKTVMNYILKPLKKGVSTAMTER